MIEHKTINGKSILCAVISSTDYAISAAYKPGSTVKELAESADIAVNFNYADTTKGAPIGRLIVDGMTVVGDIAKTLPRDELYQLPDGTLNIGKAPKDAVWAIQGSPPLLKDGKAVWKEGIVRDDLGRDIWTRDAYRTAVGIRQDGNLVIVRTINTISIEEITNIMIELGCRDALNGDGGGSSYLWPGDDGYGRKLGSALIAKEKEPKKLIALCDGHGMETAGKRTPILQGLTSETGNFMHENEFNRAVVSLLDKHLQRCGFRTLLVAPADVDTPLKTRTDAANSAKADLYLSVHANAMGAGEWNGTRGIETFHFPGSANGEKAARTIHKHLIAGTKLPDRGVKTADFHVLRETHMPSVLVECGFMTNQDDAKFLLSVAYRVECAEELARGVCEYFGILYVGEAVAPVADIDLSKAKSVCVSVNGNDVGDGFIINGVTYVPARSTVTPLGAKISYDTKTKTVNINN